MSSVVLTCGPSAVITRNLASGSLSPTLMVIVNSPCNVRICLKPGRLRAQYSVAWKRQWSRSFTVLSSAGKSAVVEKRLLLRRGASSQNTIAMGKAPEPADDVGMILGVSKVVGIAGLTKQFDATLLVGQLLRMHERHGEKFQ